MKKFGKRQFRVSMEPLPEGIELLEQRREMDGVSIVNLRLTAQKEWQFPRTLLHVTVPARGIHYRWTPKIHLLKALNLDWFQNLNMAGGFTGAPVECLMGADGKNCATIGISDTLHTVRMRSIPVEETAEYDVEIELFVDGDVVGREWSLLVRIDTRPVPYYESLQAITGWWEGQPGNQPAFIPRDAREMMYSTWYSYHQQISEAALLKQCGRASRLGMKTLLIDDGWQTEDNNRGYAYCGDWRPAPSKFPDMAAFVKKVHDLGMKVMTWYSVPFIGERSENFERFRDMLIDPKAEREWHVLDPRYPQVREFLIGTYENALRDWDLDGFKLDFVDEFVVTPPGGLNMDARRDVAGFTEAADLLMKECIGRLKRIKPDIMLEFRQTYNGPLMRSFGNIIRAVDCPFDDVENRMRVTDVRLLAGNTAVHSDMLMWDLEDEAEGAALQLIAVLFSVPQISMKLEDLPERHAKMLKHYCSLWKQYQDAFLHGSFQPGNPQFRYPVIMGYGKESLACTCHSQELIELEQVKRDMVFINGSGFDGILLRVNAKPAVYDRCICTCTGEVVRKDTVVLGSREVGLGDDVRSGSRTTGQEVMVWDVPRSGSVRLVRVK